MHTFKVHAPLNPNEAYVEMDGKRIEGVTGISFAIGVEKLTTVSLTVLGHVEAMGEFRNQEILHGERKEMHRVKLSTVILHAIYGAFPDKGEGEARALAEIAIRALESDAA